MADLFKRPGSDKWQCYCWYWADGVRNRVPRSTGIRDDGSEQSRRTAQINADKIERDLSTGAEVRRGPSKTLRQALRSITEAAELAGRSPDTLDGIMYYGANLCEHFGDGRQVASVDKDALLKYAIWSRGYREASSVERELVLMGKVFDSAGVERPDFPDLGDTSSKPQRVLEIDEQRRFLLTVPGARRFNVCGYMLAGLRLSEPWKVLRVDWSGRWLEVQGTKRSKDRKKPRLVPMCDELYEMAWPRRNESPIFPAWNLTAVDHMIRRAGQRAGICDDLSANDLRGTYATHMARAGVPQLSLAGYMGNSVKMLDEVYAQVNKGGDHMRQDAARLPRVTRAGSDALLMQLDEVSENT